MRAVLSVGLALFVGAAMGQPRGDQLRIFDDWDDDHSGGEGDPTGFRAAPRPRGGRSVVASDKAALDKLREIFVQMKWRSAAEAARMSDTDVHNTAIAEVYRDSDTEVRTLQQLPFEHVLAKARTVLAAYQLAHADDLEAAAEEATAPIVNPLEQFRTAIAALHWRSAADAGALSIDEARNVAIVELSRLHHLAVADMQQAASADLLKMVQRDLDASGAGASERRAAPTKRLSREEKLRIAAERRKGGAGARGARRAAAARGDGAGTAARAAAGKAVGKGPAAPPRRELPEPPLPAWMIALYRYKTPRAALLALEWRTSADVHKMSEDDARNSLVLEVSTRLGIALPEAQAMRNSALIRAARRWETVADLVLLTGVRSFHELMLMGVQSEVRNTALVTLAKRSGLTVGFLADLKARELRAKLRALGSHPGVRVVS